MKASGCDVPDWMLRMKKLAKDERRRRAVNPVSRKGITKRERPPADADGAGEGAKGGAKGTHAAKRRKKSKAGQAADTS